VHKLTTQSALQIAIITYLTMLVAVFSLGKAIHWMGQTYGSKQTCRSHCAGCLYRYTPVVNGFFFLYPVLWINMLSDCRRSPTPSIFFIRRTGDDECESGTRLFVRQCGAVRGLVMLVAVLGAMAVLWSMALVRKSPPADSVRYS